MSGGYLSFLCLLVAILPLGNRSPEVAPLGVLGGSPILASIFDLADTRMAGAHVSRSLEGRSRLGATTFAMLRVVNCRLEIRRPARLPTMPPSPSSTFLFCTCQPGAEQPLKVELAARRPTWRLAFSRPGFVSFKCEESVGAALDGPLPAFARTRSVSLGRVKDDALAAAAAGVWQLDGTCYLLQMQHVVGLHVWQRDSLLPGEGDFEPVVTPLALAAREAIVRARADTQPGHDTDALGLVAAPAGGVVLNVVLVEPDEWYIGWHRAASRTERWPGGMLPVAAPDNMVSRAYLKMEEASSGPRCRPRAATRGSSSAVPPEGQVRRC